MKAMRQRRANPWRWVRKPHQDRSRRTLERLLDAAESLLQERGFDNVTVAEIARQAGSSVGAFYARFRDKNGLLHHLHERFCDEAMATADAALAPAEWADASAEEILSAMITFMVETFQSRNGLFRAFLLHGCTDPRFQERGQRLGEHFLGRLTALLLARADELGHPDPEFAIGFGMEMMHGVLRDRYVLGLTPAEDRPVPPERLIAELVHAYGAYLGLQRPSARHRPAKQRMEWEAG